MTSEQFESTPFQRCSSAVLLKGQRFPTADGNSIRNNSIRLKSYLTLKSQWIKCYFDFFFVQFLIRFNLATINFTLLENFLKIGFVLWKFA